MKNILRKPFPYRYFWAAVIIAAVNVVLFLLKRFVFRKINLDYLLGVTAPGSVALHLGNGKIIRDFWWTPLTYMFMHGDFWHLFSNMLGLVIFGIPVERKIGSYEFILIYFLCGILDGIFSMAVYAWAGVPVLLIGASGAIYSILFMYAVMYPRSIISIWGIIPVPAPLLVAIYAVIEVVSQLFRRDGVAHLTHLIGFALAFVYCLVRFGINPIKIWRQAWKR